VRGRVRGHAGSDRGRRACLGSWWWAAAGRGARRRSRRGRRVRGKWSCSSARTACWAPGSWAASCATTGASRRPRKCWPWAAAASSR
jgi:hypothetical protein